MTFIILSATFPLSNHHYVYNMKFIINLFRKAPFFTGLLLLLISCHLTGIKDLTIWRKIPEVFWNIVIIYFIVAYCFSIYLPNIEKEKQESCTWTLIITNVIVLTMLAKFFA
ncbi:MAG: hypothetical protein J6W96_01475 [Alphaproteobacteria bacterium]|nr:hypothetical protein [Alphaproteobacteria bacterium]